MQLKLLGFSLILAGCLSVNLTAQEVTTPPSAQKIRSIYQPKHLNAKTIAEALSKQFGDDASIASLSDSGSNALLISADSRTHEQVVQILKALDQKPQLIQIQIAIFDVRIKPEDSKEAINDNDLRDLQNTIETSFEKLEKFQKDGKITSLKRISFSTSENQKSRQQSGSDKPMVTSSTVDRGGFGGAPNPRGNPIQSIQYRPTGWVMTALPQISDDRTITIDLQVEDSQVFTPEDGVPLGNTTASEMSTSSLQSKVQIHNGRTILAQGLRSKSKYRQYETYILVGARIEDFSKK